MSELRSVQAFRQLADDIEAEVWPEETIALLNTALSSIPRDDYSSDTERVVSLMLYAARAQQRDEEQLANTLRVHGE